VPRLSLVTKSASVIGGEFFKIEGEVNFYRSLWTWMVGLTGRLNKRCEKNVKKTPDVTHPAL
jgi:hypothetical protein